MLKLAAALSALSFTLLAFAAPAAALTRDELGVYTTQTERAWAALTAPDGRIADALEPPFGGFNYGTVMLAAAQLRGAQRSGDPALSDAAVRQLLGLQGRAFENNAFWAAGAAGILADGRSGRSPAAAFALIEAPMRAWSAALPALERNCFASRDCYTNQRLAWALGASGLADQGVGGAPGAIAADPAVIRSETRRIVNELLPASVGKVFEIPGVGPGRAMSDPTGQPNAYHIFSAALLEQLAADHPEALGAPARAIREQAANYALGLMAPDGQLTFSGRSAEQSWVLAAAADLGARRAQMGGPKAGAWRTFADRAASRLINVHGTLADGTIPVVPGLRTRYDPTIMDDYASMTQYNGLTLWFLEDALAYWPDAVPSAPLPADRAGFLAADLGGNGLIWGRSENVWWAIGSRRVGTDPRLDGGIVALKRKAPDGTWRTVLANRPENSGLPRSGFTLTSRGRTARLELKAVRGTGRTATLDGIWRLSSGRTLRVTQWTVRAFGGHLHVSAGRLSAGERIDGAVWTTAPGKLASASALSGPCVVTASGSACPQKLTHGSGLVRLTL